MSHQTDQPNLMMAGLTSIGQVRQTNQDHYLIAEMRRLLDVCDSSVINMDGNSVATARPGELLIVADGMGGHAHGGAASQLAIEYMVSYVSHLVNNFSVIDPDNDQEFRQALQAVPDEIRRRLRDVGRETPEKSRMGTTLTAAYVTWPNFYVLHVGDSACYRLQSGKLEKLTRDHTVAQAMMDSGVTKDQINNKRFHHMLWNSLTARESSESHSEPDVIREHLDPGDSLLLCSDGLTRHVSSLRIEEILNDGRDPKLQCETLIAEANDAGGRDNITAVIARFEAAPSDSHSCADTTSKPAES